MLLSHFARYSRVSFITSNVAAVNSVGGYPFRTSTIGITQMLNATRLPNNHQSRHVFVELIGLIFLASFFQLNGRPLLDFGRNVQAAQQADNPTQSSQSVTASPDTQRTYLSDSDKCYRALEQRQDAAYGHQYSAPRWKGVVGDNWKSDALAIAKALRPSGPKPPNLPPGYIWDEEDMKRELETPVPTRYENPLGAIIIRRTSRQILKAASEVGYEVKDSPRFGSLPLFGLDAENIPVFGVPNRLVAVDEMLFTFIDQMNRLAVDTVGIKHNSDGSDNIDLSDEWFDQKIRTDPEITRRMANLLLKFLNRKKFGPSGKYRPEQRLYVMGLVDSMEIFVTAHEFGHVIRGDEDIDVKNKDGGIDRTKMLASWRQELAADKLGLELTARCIDDNGVPTEPIKYYKKYAPHLFLSYFWIVEEAKYVLTHDVPPDVSDDDMDAVVKLVESKASNDEKNGLITRATVGSSHIDHPPPWLRDYFMGKDLVAVYHPDLDNNQEFMYNTAEVIEAHVKRLWRLSIPEFRKNK
jgi:hypothetical protein